MATFTGDPALLVAAPMLQDYFVDKSTGAALSGGFIYLYEDTSETTFKNWYYQTGTPGNYTFITLDNPLTLSAVGTIQDPSGNDVIPFFYPYDSSVVPQPQPYFIQVYSNIDGSPGLLQFSRNNFPYIPFNNSNEDVNPTLRNYIVNNRFWRNVSPGSSVTLTTILDAILAPSQHNGFSMPHIRFQKGVAGNTDTVYFTEFNVNNPLNEDVASQYYMRVVCSAAGTNDEYKYIQIPISLHLKTLSNVSNCTFTLQTINNITSSSTNLTINLLPFTGSGTSSPSVSPIGTIVTGPSWTKFISPAFTTPNANALTIANCGDDALYLQIAFPTNTVYDISIALPSYYISKNVPSNDWNSYDDIDSIINSYTTGDVKITLNNYSNYALTTQYSQGWVPANDGSIGSPTSTATTRANFDTWQLYKLIYTTVPDHFAPVPSRTGTSSTTAIADFNNNLPLTLTKTLGRVLAGQNPVANIPQTFTTSYSSSHVNLTSTGVGAVTFANLRTGTPVLLTNTGGALPSNLAINTVYFAINTSPTSATTIQLAKSVEDAYSQAAGFVAVSFTTNYGSGGGQSIYDVIVGSSASLPTGTRIQLSAVSGTLPSNLSANTFYYIINIDSTHVAFATSATNAFNYPPIYPDTETRIDIGSNTVGGGPFNITQSLALDLGSDQTGTSQVIEALGAYLGESYHTLSAAEMPAHQHKVPGSGAVSTTNFITFGTNTETTYQNSTIVGSSQGHNTIPPTTFMNIYIKL